MNEVIPLGLLRSDVNQWNRWRMEFPEVLPDLRGANLAAADLQGAQLSKAILTGADLTGARLEAADLSAADLRGVQFTNADLTECNLLSALLSDVVSETSVALIDVTGANFTNAWFGWTVIGDVYLNRIHGINETRHIGPSYIATSTLKLTTTELTGDVSRRSDVEEFLTRAGVPIEYLDAFREIVLAAEYHSAFISYSHSDEDFATWLYKELQKHGVQCYIDKEDMKRGDRILDALDAAINERSRILLCCSRKALNSWWVKDEIRKGQERERRLNGELLIIPILLDRFLPDEWQDGLASDLRSRLAVDFIQWEPNNPSNEIRIRELLTALSRSYSDIHKD